MKNLIIGGLLTILGATACSDKVPEQLYQAAQPLIMEAQGYCDLEGNRGNDYFIHKRNSWVEARAERLNQILGCEYNCLIPKCEDVHSSEIELITSEDCSCDDENISAVLDQMSTKRRKEYSKLIAGVEEWGYDSWLSRQPKK